VASEAAIAWTATLHPFADELPQGTDRIEFVTSRDPAGEIQQLAQRWTWAGERNRSLEQAIPIKFVRDTIVKSANRDLVLAATAPYYVVFDVEARDAPRYREYMARVLPQIEAAGGKYLVRGGPHNVYEGD
jgi:glycine/D-amino acid oxidase-like deaminating enzyme